MTTSRPVFNWPSVSTAMRLRRLFSTSVWCVSARPSSHGRPACLMRRLRRRAGAAVVAADQHHVRMRLGDAGGDRADADFGHELHADARVAVRVLQVVDQLREIFDRIDVVMRRRRDQADARRRVPRLGDPRIHLGARQLAAFAGLRALRHLDLQFLRVDQVLAGDAEAARGDLLDRASSSSRRSASGRKRSGSSPPSPVLLLPPMRFMAMASVSCASLLIEP